VRGGGVERVDLATDQEQFTFADHHVAVGELHLAFAQRLDFPAFEHHAGLKTLFNGVVEDALSCCRHGDRLEICRGLRVDPKVARRERFVAQGARGSGLFASRRPGAKSGY
jgi:hypothetical protein